MDATSTLHIPFLTTIGLMQTRLIVHFLTRLISGIAAIPARVGEVMETIPGKLGAMVDTMLANEKTLTVVEDNDESQE